MQRLNCFRNFAVILLFIFQHLVIIDGLPIIGDSSTTASDGKLSSTELPKDNVVNQDDKPNKVQQKTYDSSMFEYWLPESKGISSTVLNNLKKFNMYFHFEYYLAADWSYNSNNAIFCID